MGPPCQRIASRHAPLCRRAFRNIPTHEGTFYPLPRLFVGAVFEHSFSVERTRHKTPEVRCEKFTLAIAVASLFALLVSAFHRMSRLGREAFKSTPPMATTIAITIATGVMANARNLRAACLHKEDLGEQGQGNCQRYRQMCGRG